MTNPLKPLIEAYTKNKTLALIVVIIALGLLVYFEGENLFNWIGSKIKSGAAAASSSINQALGDQGNQSTDQATSAIEWVGNYYHAISSNPNDPFNPALYTSNAAASNLDFPTLQSVASAVASALRSGFLGITISKGSAIALKAALSPCLSQTDVSNVCIVFQQFQSANMAYAIMVDYQTSLSSLLPDSDGNDNVVNLQSCIQWINSLPKA